MARGAAKENKLGKLHDTLATVFTKVLQKYEMQLAAVDKFSELVDAGEIVADEFMAAAILELGEPSPAMLSAISKFLKDNEIMYDTEEINKLSAQEQRLADLKERRKGNVVDLTNLPKVSDG